MERDTQSTTRRDVLKTVGAAAATTGLMGVSTAAEGPVEVNVGYDSDAGRQAVVDVATDVVREFNFDALTVVLPSEALSGLTAHDDIRYVEENGEMKALAQTLPWGIDRVDAEQAHAAGNTGAGADLAIIDTGIDRGHPDLADNVGSGRTIVAGSTSLNGQDDNGHGTHCAGISAAVDDADGVVGVSTEATLHPVKVLTASGSGTTSDVAAGIEYTADQGWDVGSLSLGGGASQTLKEACEYATSKGVLLVAAAGNDGECTDCVGYPAAYDECLAVSATSSDDSLASFSSTGPEVDIAAPGDSIYSTYLAGSYSTLSGTSMACPHVSGAAAQLMANGDTASQARNRLLSTAKDIGLGPNEQGNGLLDAAAALGVDSSDDEA